jgi:hypothetical protein
MEIGIDTFAAILPDPTTGTPPSGTDRMADLLEEIEIADQVGLDVFGMGEHHRAEFLDSAPAIILAAAAARTKTIRLTSAVTVLSAADRARVFQESPLSISSRRDAPRSSLAGGLSVKPIHCLASTRGITMYSLRRNWISFSNSRETTHLTWHGRFRPSLTGQGVFPRPHQQRLPVWIGVGGTRQSFARAGALGLPLMVAIIGGSFERFRPLVDLYRESGLKAGHSANQLTVGSMRWALSESPPQRPRMLSFPAGRIWSRRLVASCSASWSTSHRRQRWHPRKQGRCWPQQQPRYRSRFVTSKLTMR